MKTGMMLGLGALAVAAVAVAAMPLQDAKAKTRGDEKGAHAADPMHEAYMKAAQPGAEHAEMKSNVGTWQAQVKSFHEPGQPPAESTGTSRYEMVMGDRFLVEHFAGEMPGMGPMEGMGILAFNNITQEYEHVWFDSFGTGLLITRGKPAEDGTLTMRGQMDNPLGESKFPCRLVITPTGENEKRFEMYCSMNGPETKMMEITYTRQGAGR